MVDTSPSFCKEIFKSIQSVTIYDDLGCFDSSQIDQAIENKLKFYPTQRSLILLECDNSIETLVNYLTCLKLNHVIMLVDKQLAQVDFDHIVADFKPNWIINGIDLKPYSDEKHQMHVDLRLLLSTSGSTGKIKFVKLSDNNLLANANGILNRLPINRDEQACCQLPFQYSYALSVIHTHLLSGANLFLTGESFISPNFWARFKEIQPTSLCGVPFSYQMLSKLGLHRLPLKSIKYMTQAGGRLNADCKRELLDFCIGQKKKLFVMYGQTELTARISIAEQSDLEKHIDTVGKPLDGIAISTNDDGELLVAGASVMEGYAESHLDLAYTSKLEQWHTGDLGYIEDDLLFITGRKSRMIKYHGNRLSLDAIQMRLDSVGSQLVIMQYKDLPIILHIGVVDKSLVLEMLPFHPQHVRFIKIDAIPTTGAGKIDYCALESLMHGEIQGLNQEHFQTPLESELKHD